MRIFTLRPWSMSLCWLNGLMIPAVNKNLVEIQQAMPKLKVLRLRLSLLFRQ